MYKPLTIINLATEKDRGIFTVRLAENTYVDVETDFNGTFINPHADTMPIYGADGYEGPFGEEDAVKAVKAFLQECGIHSAEDAAAYHDAAEKAKDTILSAVHTGFCEDPFPKDICEDEGAICCPDLYSAIAVREILGGVVTDGLKSAFEVIL